MMLPRNVKRTVRIPCSTRPKQKKRASDCVEWLKSLAMRRRGSRNASWASANGTPCLTRLSRSFAASQLKLLGRALLYGV